jgi:CO/xanthine dehydrogenase FAD-binding subunit
MSRQYLKVNSTEELLAHLSTPGAMILCGGTDLLVKMRSGLLAPTLLLDISELESLREIRKTDGRIEIGAAVTESELLASDVIREHLPLLSIVLGKLGAVQIRNRGTLGGNVVNASPAADSAIPLLLYEAEVVLEGLQGERQLPLEAFFLGPGKTALATGEFLRALSLPIPNVQFTPFFHKVGRRKALTIAIASLGALLRIQAGTVAEIRLAAGSVAPTPLRLRQVEDRLQGKHLTASLIAEARDLAAQSVSPIDDIRASATYRRTVVADLLARLLEESLHA